ncbi:MAG: Fic family protein [Fusobacteriaceae bacterium]
MELEEYFEKFTKASYLTKEEIRYRIPRNLELNEVWEYILQNRKNLGVITQFKDQSNDNFFYYNREILKDKIKNLEEMSRLDFEKTASKNIKNRILEDYLIEEALNSSAIEGAFSTKKQTEDLVKSKRTPENKSEKMILNNYNALNFINETITSPITEELLLELYKIIVKETLEEEDITERYRTGDVFIKNERDEIIYKAPNCEQVSEMMKELLEYANTKTDEDIFIKASIIHFYFVYIHPFFDGNGRTARALTYMFLIKSGYEFFRFFSISMVINEKRSKYYRAIKNSEDFGSDMTYFIDFNIEMMLEAIQETISRYGNEYLKIEILKYLEKYRITLPKSLEEELKKFLNRKDKQLTLKKYIKSTKLAESTAKKHLNLLVNSGILKKEVLNKETVYIPNDLNYFIKENYKK